MKRKNSWLNTLKRFDCLGRRLKWMILTCFELTIHGSIFWPLNPYASYHIFGSKAINKLKTYKFEIRHDYTKLIRSKRVHHITHNDIISPLYFTKFYFRFQKWKLWYTRVNNIIKMEPFPYHVNRHKSSRDGLVNQHFGISTMLQGGVKLLGSGGLNCGVLLYWNVGLTRRCSHESSR